jgi:hypothetical protein
MLKVVPIISAFIVAGFSLQIAQAIELSPSDAAKVGRKVWVNECGGTIKGLVSWNTGEAFPSLGIGHFIWYPAGKRGPFDESFPKLVELLQKRGVRVPGWLKGASPWETREAMEADTKRVAELRSLLADTVGIQTEFLIARLDAALSKMLPESNQATRVRQNFERVGASPAGAFALIDYVNFKGEGVLATERYAGEGWGLLQVLEGMRTSNAETAVAEFAESAKRVLSQRVANAPKERREERWIPGWHARVERYKSAL